MHDTGAYQLVIKVKEDCKIKIGALGELQFVKGLYIYTGSAMSNLGARVARHLRKEKKLHWHIDYLLASPHTEIVEVKRFQSEKRIECKLNEAVALQNGAVFPHSLFGSSDCGRCVSHLVMVK